MDTLRVTPPVRVPGAVLITIEHLRVEHSENPGFRWVHGRATPWAIVVQQDGDWRAFDLAGAELPLPPLLEAVPDLASALRDHSRPSDTR